ncbi:MAG TPA: hypothetical protein VII93_15685 [Anaerolineales bacterium]
MKRRLLAMNTSPSEIIWEWFDPELPAAQRQRVQPPLVTGQARYTTNNDTPAKYFCSRRV